MISTCRVGKNYYGRAGDQSKASKRKEIFLPYTILTMRNLLGSIKYITIISASFLSHLFTVVEYTANTPTKRQFQRNLYKVISCRSTEMGLEEAKKGIKIAVITLGHSILVFQQKRKSSKWKLHLCRAKNS